MIKVSQISLVDLAGSERAKATGVSGKALREGANINKSLTTLGKVISSLADPDKKGKDAAKFIPYRDSVLTWLLKDSLGGNSKTAMIATASPSEVNFEETLSTLRYADRAKNIKCNAIVNEDPNAKLIKSLHDEIANLKLTATKQLEEQEENLNAENMLKIKETEDKLKFAENLIEELNESWEEKLKKTEEIHQERAEILMNMGVALNIHGDAIGVSSSKRTPHLLNLNEDPLMSECLLYYINDLSKNNGYTKIGADDNNHIVLVDSTKNSIQDEHLEFVCKEIEDCEDSEVDQNPTTINYPRMFVNPVGDALLYINGSPVTEQKELTTGDRLTIGTQHLFRFQNPESIS